MFKTCGHFDLSKKANVHKFTSLLLSSQTYFLSYTSFRQHPKSLDGFITKKSLAVINHKRSVN